MGSQIATCVRDSNRRDQDKDPDTLRENLLSLPNEVLVRILSFLPEIRDRIKLRCVSRKLRSISETPSLWRDFVWADYYRGDEKRLCNIVKVCGVHIRRLSFPQKLIQPSREPRGDVPKNVTGATLKSMPISQMVKVLHYCKNLIHLRLPALDHSHSCSDDLDEQL